METNNDVEAIARRDEQQRRIDSLGERRRWTPEQIAVLKATIAKGSTDDELRLFLAVASRSGLDPFSRQIYLIRRWDTRLQQEVATIQTGIDGYRTLAQRSGQYRGQLGPWWCGLDGQWREVWLEDEPPVAAKVTVLRTGFEHGLSAIARWKSYHQVKKDGSTTQMWKTFDAEMLAKVAEALALRKAFPLELSGLYTHEELDQSVDPPTIKKLERGGIFGSTVNRVDRPKNEHVSEATEWSPERANEEAHHRREALERGIGKPRRGRSVAEQEIDTTIELARQQRAEEREDPDYRPALEESIKQAQEKKRGTGEPQRHIDAGEPAETAAPRSPIHIVSQVLGANTEENLIAESVRDAAVDESLGTLDAELGTSDAQPMAPAWREEAKALMRKCGWKDNRHDEIAGRLLKADHGVVSAIEDDDAQAWELIYRGLVKRYTMEGKKREAVPA